MLPEGPFSDQKKLKRRCLKNNPACRNTSRSLSMRCICKGMEYCCEDYDSTPTPSAYMHKSFCMRR